MEDYGNLDRMTIGKVVWKTYTHPIHSQHYISLRRTRYTIHQQHYMSLRGSWYTPFDPQH